MAGIYLHIPFCKQACHYCDFHFSTNLSRKTEMVQAIMRELKLRKDFLREEPVQSIYFGGGTPSLLNDRELSNILETIFQTYKIAPNAEITLEANPDDINTASLKLFKSSGINRLSIGIQTFDDKRLKFINRGHTSEEAVKSLTLAKAAGFENLSADLIYAIPPNDNDYWESDLEKMISFDLPHLSIYGLTIEEKTVFGNWHKKGRLKEVPEETSAQQFRKAHDLLTRHAYEHYEVSNYAMPGKYSQHNTAYWKDQKYLGVGPGAHSYDGEDRSYNVSHNSQYLKAISQNSLPLTIEKLTPTDRANEHIFTHLRTQWGVNLAAFQKKHHQDLLADHQKTIDELRSNGMMKISGDALTLTLEGYMLADEISWRLFYDQE